MLTKPSKYTGKYKDNEWVSYLVDVKVDTVQKLNSYVKEILGRNIIESTVRYKTPIEGLPYVMAYLEEVEDD
jgi:hypothetical protein